MLCLGLGTGLGSALIVDNVLEPMELAHLPYKKGRTYEDYVGMAGLKQLGKKKWPQEVMAVVRQLKEAMQVDYVVLGGGNARLLKNLPPCTRLGNNADAFKGGYRLWTLLVVTGARHRVLPPSSLSSTIICVRDIRFL
jgi:polyphosphate glucokinase